MTVYVVAQLTFTDRASYDRYQSRFMETFRGSGGRLLAADESPRAVEGEWPHQKLVLLSFPDEATWRRWHEGEPYQRIAADRRAGAQGPVLLVHGVDGARVG